MSKTTTESFEAYVALLNEGYRALCFYSLCEQLVDLARTLPGMPLALYGSELCGELAEELPQVIEDQNRETDLPYELALVRAQRGHTVNTGASTGSTWIEAVLAVRRIGLLALSTWRIFEQLSDETEIELWQPWRDRDLSRSRGSYRRT